MVWMQIKKERKNIALEKISCDGFILEGIKIRNIGKFKMPKIPNLYFIYENAFAKALVW
jgi:hypothetical protein